MEIILWDESIELFFLNSQESTQAKILRTIDLLEKFGNQLAMPHSKKISNKMFELRIRGKSEVRIIYTYKNKKAYLLHAFIKKSQKIPKREIKTAKARLRLLDNT